jgi:hypothetical protein
MAAFAERRSRRGDDTAAIALCVIALDDERRKSEP